MESKSFIQTLKNKNWRFENATSLEDVLCLAVLTSHNHMSRASDVDEARSEWLENFGGDCYKCQFCKNCLACIINE